MPAVSAGSPGIKDLLESGERYGFSDGFVTARGPKGASEMQWNAFSGAIRLRDFYALRFATGPSLIIPRAAFTSPEQEQSFLTLVRGKLGSSAKL